MSETPAGEANEPLADSEAAETGPQDELAAALAAAEEAHNQYLRTAAELENQRRRTAREIDNARQYGIERFARELLDVVDSLEMGLEAGPNASVETLLEGKQATLRLLQSALQKSGVQAVDPAGEPFDPQLHEAMSMLPSPEAEPGSVMMVVQKGYTLNGRLLRPARVVVAAEAQENQGEA